MILAAWGALIAALLGLAAIYLLWAYARKDTSYYVMATVVVSWYGRCVVIRHSIANVEAMLTCLTWMGWDGGRFLCFVVCLLLPIDLVPNTQGIMSEVWYVRL